MKFTLSWLRDHLDTDAPLREITDTLTALGLELEELHDRAAGFENFVVGEVISCEPHPDADRLSVCTVDTGSGTVDVVCGAPNAREGLKAPFARVGALLPGDLKIKKAKLRGEPSEGMLCGGSELGLEDRIDGLLELPEDAPLGTDIRDYLSLNDTNAATAANNRVFFADQSNDDQIVLGGSDETTGKMFGGVFRVEIAGANILVCSGQLQSDGTAATPFA